MSQKYRQKIIPTVCVFILTPALIYLGFWQLDRAQHKAERMQSFAARTTAPTITVGAQMETPNEIEFHSVKATGVWDQTKEFLLDNQVLNSRAGYHVITPLILRDGKTAVLVNRGWVAAKPDRRQLPQVEEVLGTTTVSGVAVVPPSESFLLKEQNPIEQEWEKVWQALDLDRFREALDYRLHEFVIVLDEEHSDVLEYHLNKPTGEWIIRHKAYAFQWFALAATLLVIYFVVGFRRKRSSTQ